jgi:hypothetical protein
MRRESQRLQQTAHSLLFPIDLIAHQSDHYILWGILIGVISDEGRKEVLSSYVADFDHPIRNRIERANIRNVVDKKDPLRSSKVRGCNRSKSFLSGGVPDLSKLP